MKLLMVSVVPVGGELRFERGRPAGLLLSVSGGPGSSALVRLRALPATERGLPRPPTPSPRGPANIGEYLCAVTPLSAPGIIGSIPTLSLGVLS